MLKCEKILRSEFVVHCILEYLLVPPAPARLQCPCIKKRINFTVEPLNYLVNEQNYNESLNIFMSCLLNYKIV